MGEIIREIVSCNSSYGVEALAICGICLVFVVCIIGYFLYKIIKEHNKTVKNCKDYRQKVTIKDSSIETELHK